MDVDEIKEALGLPGKSRAGLAAALEVDVSQISRLLNGKRHLKVHEVEIIRSYFYGTDVGPVEDRTSIARAALAAQAKVFNLDIIRDLLDEADRCGIDLATTITAALGTAIEENSGDVWRRENDEGVRQYVERVQRRGVFAEGMTTLS